LHELSLAQVKITREQGESYKGTRTKVQRKKENFTKERGKKNKGTRKKLQRNEEKVTYKQLDTKGVMICYGKYDNFF
jgi:hypothetical protein